MKESNTTHTNCLVCKSDQIHPLPNYYEKHSLVKCKACGFVFMEKTPTIIELDQHYSSYCYGSEGFLSPLTIKVYNDILDEFEKYRQTNKLLDVGCGRGWFLQEAKKRGWEVYGTEYSETAINICRNNGIEVQEGQLNQDMFKKASFDIVTSFEVIEHINNPNEELQIISSLLRKEGLFYCTTPNFNSLLRYYLKADYNIIAYPEQLSYYTKKTLNKVVQNNGFKKIKFLSTGISITRIQTSLKKSNEAYISESSADEKLRANISKKWYLGLVKRVVNKLLTLFNWGITLKGYYIKT